MKNQDEKLAKTRQDNERKTRQENERLRNEIHNLKRQVKRLKEKDDTRKAERKASRASEQKFRKEEVMEMSMDDIKKKTCGCGGGAPGGGSDGITHVEGYRHAEEIIKMAALMYTYAGCSFRSVAKAVEVINFVFPSLGLAEVLHTSVRDWVRKIGLDVYRRKPPVNHV